jgi:DNA-binding XRE family transcriptional regulator
MRLLQGHGRDAKLLKATVERLQTARRTAMGRPARAARPARARRRAAGLTQPQLAEAVGMSITTVGHAETGRLWQSRRFWELADKELRADGELLALHDAYRAASVSPGTAAVTEMGTRSRGNRRRLRGGHHRRRARGIRNDQLG